MREKWIFCKRQKKLIRAGTQRINKERIHIIRDIDPYQSMITGEMITSRSHHRNHLRQHDCLEVGNERIGDNRRYENDVNDIRSDIKAVFESKNQGRYHD
ncbi:hypothetical protein UFOVP413_18 [uncultured Caudovirales phage]|uniref:Uncharacterized protein n=1 Tax=uncultured Caudovirales phage TaxID=2100421 RepID=A0A6J5M6D4_9CAUD|nr:hypothetical protein UFOVP413_18 [uncultured Caudovirales phage]